MRALFSVYSLEIWSFSEEDLKTKDSKHTDQDYPSSEDLRQAYSLLWTTGFSLMAREFDLVEMSCFDTLPCAILSLLNHSFESNTGLYPDLVRQGSKLYNQ